MTKYLNAEIFTFLFGKTASFFFCLFEDPFFYFVIFLLVISNSLEAQDRLELIHADFSRGQMSGQKEEVKILEGSVHVRQDTVEIFCDRALYYRGEGKLILEGHVRLIRGSETLTAKKVTYYENRKLAIAEQNVRVKRPGQEMHSEYLEYYYETDQAFAKTNLLLCDEDSRAYVAAAQGEYIPQENRSKVEENAHFWQVDSSGRDTLHIYARVMEYFFQPGRKATAKDSVKIVRGDLIALCDSALYLLDQERVFLEIQPRAQQKNNQLFGTQMEMDLSGMELRQIMVRGNAVALSVEDSSAEKTNRLTGQEIIAFIVAQKIDQLWAYNNARSKYYLKEKEQGQGVNVTSADTIGFFFKEGELDHIGVKGGSQGIYYPEGYQGKIESEY
jgi:lipopolysaccharide export system protein LptA